MKTPQIELDVRVSASTATAVTLTPNVDSPDRAAAGLISTLVINGSALTGYAVGDRIHVRLNAMQ
jgi:hypothetical protein